MNAKAAELGLHDTHFVRPDGLDAPGAYSSAADVTTLARTRCASGWCATPCACGPATIQGGQVLHTWDDLLGTFPNVLGVKTGHTGNAGWCQVAAVRGRGVTVYATILGSPSRSVRNAGLASLLSWGLAQFRVVTAIDPQRVYASVGLPYGLRAAAPSRPAKALRRRRARRAAVRRARVGEAGRVAAGEGRRGARPGPGLERPQARRQPRPRRDARRRAARPRRPGTLVRQEDRPSPPEVLLLPVIVTVTLNAAIDRTLTVPNFQRGQRHRASAGVTLAGGKGINVARALKALGVPVVATGLVGGVTGTRIVEELTGRGDPQRLRAHRGRVADVDGRRRSDREHVHRDQRVGPGRDARTSSVCCSTSSTT